MQAIEISASEEGRSGSEGSAHGELAEVLRRSLQAVLRGERGEPRSAPENLGAALILVKGGPGSGEKPLLAHYRGDRPFFPADLVSLFYLAGVTIQLKLGAIAEDKNVERDILRMVRADDRDAANLIFDRITGTLSGPELPEANLELFARRRGRLDELLRGIGINGTRCVQKIWDRLPYGRDAQLLGEDKSLENQTTAVAAAALLAKLLLGQVGSPERSREMLDLLRIDLPEGGGDGLPKLRIAAGLPTGSRVFGRRTSTPRLLHEAAAIELFQGPSYVLVVLSYLGERQEGILEVLGRSVAEGIARTFAGHR